LMPTLARSSRFCHPAFAAPNSSNKSTDETIIPVGSDAITDTLHPLFLKVNRQPNFLRLAQQLELSGDAKRTPRAGRVRP
jgi:hypothetical protein